MQITIVGLGMIGQSIGLALKQVAPNVSIVGHDPEASRVKSARSTGAIDKSHWNLVSACDGADIILLDVPLKDLPLTLDAIGPDLGPYTVVSDLISIKGDVMAIAKDRLTQSANFVGGHLVSPALLDLDKPDARWLASATYFLVAPPSLSPAAMDKMANLADALGAKPQFISAEEHDGLVAAMQQLPELAGAALFDALTSPSGARDRANAIGIALAAHGAAIEGAALDANGEWMVNRENLVYWLDQYVNRLIEVRELLTSENANGLNALSETARQAAHDWLVKELPDDKDADTAHSPWRSMFLGGLSIKRRKRDAR